MMINQLGVLSGLNAKTIDPNFDFLMNSADQIFRFYQALCQFYVSCFGFNYKGQVLLLLVLLEQL